MQETEVRTNFERIEKISQAIGNEFTEEEIMQILEYLFYKNAAMREGAEILEEILEEVEFRIVE